jgi:hypothetical protein
LAPETNSIVQAAIQDLAQRLGVAAGEITVISVEEVNWPDTSLGLPEPGKMYAQVIIPGARIRLAHSGTVYEYHSGGKSLKYAGVYTP